MYTGEDKVNTTDNLIKAKAIIADPANFTTEAMARDYSGECVNANSPSATCFCSLGALMKSSGYEYMCGCLRSDEYINLNTAAKILDKNSFDVVDFNDRNSHERVMEMFDLAIKLSKEKITCE